MDDITLPDPLVVETMTVSMTPNGLFIRGRAGSWDVVIEEFRGPYQTHLQVKAERIEGVTMVGATTLFSPMYPKGTKLTVDNIRSILASHADEHEIILPAFDHRDRLPSEEEMEEIARQVALQLSKRRDDDPRARNARRN